MAGKINAKKKMIDGYLFDSEAEARRYLILKSRWQHREITQLMVHPTFQIAPEVVSYASGKRKVLSAIKFTPDFSYREDMVRVIEDVKPHKLNKAGKRVPYMTTAFRLRWNILQRHYPDWIFRIVDA